MAFETLINKPMAEQKLLGLIVAEVQSHYSNLQGLCFFLKLGKVDSKQSQIEWIKTFEDEYQLHDFYFDSKYKRACIMIKFRNNQYELLCQGHFLCDSFEILINKIINSRPFESVDDCENQLMIPFELLRNAFGEIAGALSTVKRGKAV